MRKLRGLFLSATDGSDFIAISGQVIDFANGVRGAWQLEITVFDDGFGEVDENFTVTLSALTGGTVPGVDTSVVTIFDDEAGGDEIRLDGFQSR